MHEDYQSRETHTLVLDVKSNNSSIISYCLQQRKQIEEESTCHLNSNHRYRCNDENE